MKIENQNNLAGYKPLFQIYKGISKNNLQRAIDDIIKGWSQRELWIAMGLQEIRQRYRRSKIGPFWLTISMGVMVLALGILYGSIFGQELSNYLPYLSAGFVIWGLISGLILDGVNSFIQAEGLIKQLPAPLSIYVYRTVWSNLIIFFHNIIIFFMVSAWFGYYPNHYILLVFPILLLLLANGLWLGLLLGLLSARFRDIPQIVASLVQIMFFITPVIWKPEMLPGKTLVINANPFYYLVEIIRAPLMGSLPPTSIFIGVSIITLIGWVITITIYGALRWRIPYWV